MSVQLEDFIIVALVVALLVAIVVVVLAWWLGS